MVIGVQDAVRGRGDGERCAHEESDPAVERFMSKHAVMGGFMRKDCHGVDRDAHDRIASEPQDRIREHRDNDRRANPERRVNENDNVLGWVELMQLRQVDARLGRERSHPVGRAARGSGLVVACVPLLDALESVGRTARSPDGRAGFA